MRILLVEDEKRMAEALTELLRMEKYDVDWFADGADGLEAALSDVYDLMILDVMLPVRSGTEIAGAVRKSGLRTPILMLTAKGELEDKVYGLDSGADDYMTKPFMTQELLARLRALQRRNAGIVGNILKFGDLILNTETSALLCKDESVRLGEKEFRLMEYLIINQGHILSREQLALKIWGYENEAEYNNVEVYLSFVRKKLSFIHSKVSIKAVRGLGYELRYTDV